MTPLDAATLLAAENRLRFDEAVVLKHGSNLLVRLSPAPVVLRIATFTALVRGDPLPYLARPGRMGPGDAGPTGWGRAGRTDRPAAVRR